MPNGMYGGVRGQRKSALLDFKKLYKKNTVNVTYFCFYVLPTYSEINI